MADKKTIFLIDDNESTLKQLKKAVIQSKAFQDWEIRPFVTVQQGLDAMELKAGKVNLDKTPDFIITDNKTPGMYEGMELLGIMRFTGVPCILHTSSYEIKPEEVKNVNSNAGLIYKTGANLKFFSEIIDNAVTYTKPKPSGNMPAEKVDILKATGVDSEVKVNSKP